MALVGSNRWVGAPAPTRVVFSLARGVVLEAIRRKDLWVVAILGGVIVLAAGVLGVFGIEGLEVFVKDLGLTVLGALSTVTAILTASRVLPDEIRNRTLYPLLARPISRWDLLLGKFVGVVLVSWIAFGLLASLVFLAMATFRIPFEGILLQYTLLKLVGLVVVCAVSLALSAAMTPSAAATMSFVLIFGAPLISRGLTMGYATADAATQVLFRVLNGVLPQVGLFDLRGRAVYYGWSAVPNWVVLSLIGYAFLYTSAMLGLAWWRFRRQAI